MVEPRHVEELNVRKGDLNMRLIINHSHKHLRFMDFRVGNYEMKRELLDGTALEHGLRKVFTLVEKQDTGSWRNVGFSREGVYPSFFRTADAYVMSRMYGENGAQRSAPAITKTPVESNEERPALTQPDRATFQLIRDVKKRADFMVGFNGQLRSIPFGRADIPDLVLHARARSQEGWVAAEIDDSFGHAILGFAPPPSDQKELKLCAFAGQRVAEVLVDNGINNLFGLSPGDDVWAHHLFSELDFKVTGRLANHLSTGDGSDTALVWHRRLAARK